MPQSSTFRCDISSKEHSCGSCGVLLQVKWFRSGQYAEHYGLHCWQCPWSFGWMNSEAKDAEDNGWIPPPKTTAAVAKKKKTMKPQKDSRPQRERCRYTDCPGGRMNHSCDRGFCLGCCSNQGGCTAPGHRCRQPIQPLSNSPSRYSASSLSNQRPRGSWKRLLNDSCSDEPMAKKARRHSSRTGPLNVITEHDMTHITPRPRIPPELALIDWTLEALEADEPDWDMPWRRNDSLPSPSSSVPSSSLTSSTPPSSAPSSQPSPSSFPVFPWPSGVTTMRIDNQSSHRPKPRPIVNAHDNLIRTYRIRASDPSDDAFYYLSDMSRKHYLTIKT
ncbi:hypothetical protein BT96DRAFT_999316 [Gymnopus androsaceus JB14]|uniref:Uncharacterized protein n=1 Tax=Gymnopus androsaceus JB14 TaxID=1447944 RepID=A0A6A4H799_9AGAR|nr:hypothetical protein BT96DRAFT_999316 [Gymnopus androsaceus JB14]